MQKVIALLTFMLLLAAAGLAQTPEVTPAAPAPPPQIWLHIRPVRPLLIFKTGLDSWLFHGAQGAHWTLVTDDTAMLGELRDAHPESFGKYSIAELQWVAFGSEAGMFHGFRIRYGRAENMHNHTDERYFPLEATPEQIRKVWETVAAIEGGAKVRGRSWQRAGYLRGMFRATAGSCQVFINDLLAEAGISTVKPMLPFSPGYPNPVSIPSASFIRGNPLEKQTPPSPALPTGVEGVTINQDFLLQVAR
jgi:hypothetical protein